VLYNEKIVLTGVSGQIAFPLARALAQHNEVVGVARFSDEKDIERVKEIGVTPIACDLSSGHLDDIPTDATVLLHLAAYQGAGLDYDHAIAHNAEATGFIMEHCKGARGALVMSTSSTYRPNSDPYHAFKETDPLGEGSTPWAPTYQASKLAQEGVARYCARAYNLPTILARMNAAYGPNGGLPAYHLDAMRAGRAVVTRHDPCPYSPIFEDDLAHQVGALIDGATVPARVVNWSGDEVVSVQEWSAYMGELTGITPTVTVSYPANSHIGMVQDPTLRRSITGLCKVGWKEGLARTVAERPAPKS
jgi:nucleoside-diphosphate-sugar epimerase